MSSIVCSVPSLVTVPSSGFSPCILPGGPSQCAVPPSARLSSDQQRGKQKDPDRGEADGRGVE
ncbi:hypothetical protein OF83DRAFT_1142440 [Amylostereum chailletii]|nr:hypothetical protein OF83DRAFT_1142440 [Amylostereum chailletii]